MRIKSAEYNQTINTRVSKKTLEKLIELAIKHKQSKSEFVRDAVEFYIKYLNSINDTTTNTVIDNKESNPRIGSSFDEFFDNEFFSK